MTYVRYAGPWEDVAVDRHCILARRMDTDDLTVAHILPDSEDPALRPGEVPITKEQYEQESETIAAHNAAIPPPPPPPPPPNPVADAAVALKVALDKELSLSQATKDAMNQMVQALGGS